MKEHYAAQELAEILSVSRPAIIKRAKKESWKTTKDGRKRPYLADSLPSDIQKEIALAEVEQIARTSPALPAVETSLIPIPPKDILQAGLDRYSAVVAWRAYVRAAGHGGKGEATQAFLLAYHSGQEIPEVFARLGKISDKSIYRWDKQLRDSGDDYLILCTKKGKWLENAEPRNGQLSKKQAETFLQLWLQPKKPSIRLAYRGAKALLRKKGVEPPSYTTFYRFAQNWKKKNKNLYVLARHGEKALKDQVAPYITRDHNMLSVGDCLVADGHKLNFLIRHPKTGKPARMQMIVFFDWASRWPVGWQIMPTEDTVAIHAAFRHACINLGKYPRSVLLDNGKAFKARVFTQTQPDFREFEGLYTRLGVEPYFAAPYNARSKVVERWFGTFNEQFERLVPSYTGSSIGDKPAWMQRNEKFHQQWQQAQSQGWVPDIREAAHIINLYINWYGEQVHSELDGRTPLEIFESGRGPGIDLDELNYHFLWSEQKPVRNCRITLWGIDYEADCLLNLSDVEVKYDTADMSRVLLYAGRRFIGEALPVRALNPLARLFDDQVGLQEVKEATRRQNLLVKKTKQGLMEIMGQDSADFSDAMDWHRKAPVLGKNNLRIVGKDEAEPMSDEERTRLEQFQVRAIESGNEDDMPERPSFFRSDWERYEWCLRAKHEHGCNLPAEDEIFMVDFQKSDEWPRYEQTVEDLMLVFEMMKQKEAAS